MYDIEFEKLTDQQLYDKIATLHKQLSFYQYNNNEQVVESILTMLEVCYNIRDERNYKRLHDKITLQDGVVLDAVTHGQKTEKEKPKKSFRRPTT